MKLSRWPNFNTQTWSGSSVAAPRKGRRYSYMNICPTKASIFSSRVSIFVSFTSLHIYNMGHVKAAQSRQMSSKIQLAVRTIKVRLQYYLKMYFLFFIVKWRYPWCLKICFPDHELWAFFYKTFKISTRIKNSITSSWLQMNMFAKNMWERYEASQSMALNSQTKDRI